MNKYRLTKAGIDVNEGIHRFSENAALYEHFLTSFPDDPHFPALCDAVAQGNVTEAFAQAHALKGVVGNLSMKRFYELLSPLVEQLRVGDMSQAAAEVAEMQAEYNEIIKALGG